MHEDFIEYMKEKERLAKMKDKIPPNHPMKFKLDEELARLKAKVVMFYLVLMEENIINPTIKLFNLLLFMLPNWIGVDYDDLQDCKMRKKSKPNEIIYFLPEHLLYSIYKYHISIFEFK